MQATEYSLSPRTTSMLVEQFMTNYANDPAFFHYEEKLRDFILTVTQNAVADTTPLANRMYRFRETERESINLRDGARMYRHDDLYVKGPSYTGDAVVDVINRKDGNFITRDMRELCRYSYRFGQLVDLFHITIDNIPGRQGVQEIKMMFVRWYEIEQHGHTGPINPSFWSNCPPRLSYIPATQHSAFGFLSCDQVIRAVTLTPDITSGITRTLLGPSVMRYGHAGDHDYNHYVISCFNDHDIFFRLHLGLDMYNLMRVVFSSVRPPHEDDEMNLEAVLPPFLFSGRPYHPLDNPVGFRVRGRPLLREQEHRNGNRVGQGHLRGRVRAAQRPGPGQRRVRRPRINFHGLATDSDEEDEDSDVDDDTETEDEQMDTE